MRPNLQLAAFIKFVFVCIILLTFLLPPALSEFPNFRSPSHFLYSLPLAIVRSLKTGSVNRSLCECCPHFPALTVCLLTVGFASYIAFHIVCKKKRTLCIKHNLISEVEMVSWA